MKETYFQQGGVQIQNRYN